MKCLLLPQSLFLEQFNEVHALKKILGEKKILYNTNALIRNLENCLCLPKAFPGMKQLCILFPQNQNWKTLLSPRCFCSSEYFPAN